jgi:exosortase B
MNQTALPSSESSPAKPQRWLDVEGWSILIALAALYLPTIVKLDQQIWNIVGQGHGPVMLALSAWLAKLRWEAYQALPQAQRPFASLLTHAPMLLLAGCCYIVGRSQDVLLLECVSFVMVLMAIIGAYRGVAGLKLMWFPLFFLLFALPLPGFMVDAMTAPLKSAVSYVSEHLLFWAGYPIGRAGVTLTIGPYQLLVADACSGINSVFALEAVGVFYLSVTSDAPRWRNIALAILILPISFFSNVARVVTLVLITYYLGDEVGQGFAHSFAGIFLFTVATILMIAVDQLLVITVKKLSHRQQSA